LKKVERFSSIKIDSIKKVMELRFHIVKGKSCSLDSMRNVYQILENISFVKRSERRKA